MKWVRINPLSSYGNSNYSLLNRMYLELVFLKQKYDFHIPYNNNYLNHISLFSAIDVFHHEMENLCLAILVPDMWF